MRGFTIRRGPGGQRVACALSALLVLLVLLLPPFPTASADPSTPPGSADSSSTAPSDGATEQAAPGSSVTVTSFSPGTLRPGEDLTVTARVTAGADPILAGSRLELRLRRERLSTRYSVSAWSTGGRQDAVGSILEGHPITTAIPAGGSTSVTFRVPATQIGLADVASAFGPYGVSVVLRDPQAARLYVARSFTVWYPARTAVRELAMTVLVPVTAGEPAPSTGLPVAATLAADTAQDGRLAALLSASDRPGVTLAVDPSVLVSTRADEARSQIAAWRRQLVGQGAANGTLALPSGNPDVAALSADDSLFSWSVSQGKAQGSTLGSPLTGIAMPAAGLLDHTSATLLNNNGFRCAVIRESAQPSMAEQRVTPTGRSLLSWPNHPETKPLCGLLADDVLTDLLAGPTADNPDAPVGVAAVQRVLAETAAIAEQDPSQPRHLLAVAPIEWDPGATGAPLLSAMLGQPWTAPRRLSTLLARTPPSIAREVPTITAHQRADELGAARVNSIRQQLSVAKMTSRAATSDSSKITDDLRQPAVGLVSQAWRGDDEAWRAAVGAFTSRVTSIRHAVHVVPGSDITQVSRNVRLPVTVQNDLDVPVTVFLRALPATNLLKVVESVIEVNVPRKSRTVSYVSVRGVGSGDTSVKVDVVTADGFTLDGSSAIEVRVRADWENRATLVIGTGFLVILVAGIARTLRRGQTRAASIDPTTGESAR